MTSLDPTSIDLDHVAVAVEHWHDGWPRYGGDLGGEWLAGGDAIGFSSCQLRYANGMKVELLQPHRPELNDFLRRFLDRNGPGPHHLTYKVHDIVSALEAAEVAGYRPVNVDLSDPFWKEAFLHPKDAPGVVVQLAQSGGDWEAPVPDGFPSPRVEEPATLSHVAHAVASLDEGLRLFAGLLAGQEVAAGTDAATGARWVELGWKGPGRVRLVTPVDAGKGPVADWLGDRAGRVLHLAFSVEDPAGVPDAVPVGEGGGGYRVPAEANQGVGLVLVG
jgi:methylmalonyl-CoA/ethylmalonyl-CoA epimerase